MIPADGAVLGHVLDSTYRIGQDGLDRRAYGKFYAAQTHTAWGRFHQRRFALVDGPVLLASAEQYDLAGRLDKRPVRICGIGSVVTDPAHRGCGHARVLLETLLDRATRSGADLALLFNGCVDSAQGTPDLEDDARNGFEAIPWPEATLQVAESPRHGAPMTMVRGGEERDLAAIVAMGRVRADPFRFHLDRDVDLVHYAITRKRLLAGLGSAGGRQLNFFIAEEGITAAAYVVVSVAGGNWTLEECGDRDASGARVGALLQALIAREPAERRPTIRGCLPTRFLPPQLAIASTTASTSLMVRGLGSAAMRLQLSEDDVLYWRNDVF